MRTKLDTTAIVHTALMSKKHINMYRIIITVKETVDPVLLQRALDKMVDRFPMICSRIVSDSHWYYLEKMERIIVREDDRRILGSLDCHNVFSQAVNIMYSGREIIMEAFHSVTDGFGAFTFLNCLVAEYAHLKYGDGEELNWGIVSDREREDSFVKFGDASQSAEKLFKVKNAFTFEGEETRQAKFTTFRLNLRNIKDTAKRRQCTLNEMIITMFYSAIFRIDNTINKDVVLTIPVNLRNKFDSASLLNFTYLAKTVVRKTAHNKPEDEIIREIRSQMLRQNNREYLHKAITPMGRLQTSLLMKICPLWLKTFMIRTAVRFGADNTLMTVSNLGDISRMLPDAAHIVNVDTIISPRRNSPYNCCIASLGNIMNINFTHGNPDSPFMTNLRLWLRENGIAFEEYRHQ